MSFIKNPEDVAGGIGLGNDLYFHGRGDEAKTYPSEILTVLYETKPEVIKKLLPPPLKPLGKPYVTVLVCDFMKASFDRGYNGPGYLETVLNIPCEHQGTRGNFCLGMNLNTDMGVFIGRDVWGYPKKYAYIRKHYENGLHYTGFAERHGIPFVVVTAVLDGKPNDPDFLKELESVEAHDPEKPGYGVNFTYKWAFGKNEAGKEGSNIFMHKPLLVKEWEGLYNATTKIGSADIHYTWSDDDPWAEVEVVRVLGATLTTGEFVMHGPCEYTEVDEEEFLPYAFYGWDHNPKW